MVKPVYELGGNRYRFKKDLYMLGGPRIISEIYDQDTLEWVPYACHTTCVEDISAVLANDDRFIALPNMKPHLLVNAGIARPTGKSITVGFGMSCPILRLTLKGRQASYGSYI